MRRSLIASQVVGVKVPEATQMHCAPRHRLFGCFLWVIPPIKKGQALPLTASDKKAYYFYADILPT